MILYVYRIGFNGPYMELNFQPEKGENMMLVEVTGEQFNIIVDTLLEHGEDVLARAFVKSGLVNSDEDAEAFVTYRRRLVHKAFEKIDKMDLIKIYGAFTKVELVAAKFAVDVFLVARGIEKSGPLTSVKDFHAFMWYIHRYVDNTYYINGTEYDNMNLLYSPKPKPVSFDDIKAIKG